jgi:hypothetical protein
MMASPAMLGRHKDCLKIRADPGALPQLYGTTVPASQQGGVPSDDELNLSAAQEETERELPADVDGPLRPLEWLLRPDVTSPDTLSDNVPAVGWSSSK